jgi:hypothetical protein
MKKQTKMKSETDTIISALRVLARDIHTDDGVVNACLEEAAGRLEELQLELTETKEELDCAHAEIKRARKNQQPTTVMQQLTTRPEPSRLEIAAMLLAAMCGSAYTWTNAEGLALRKADVLIATAKEGK